MTRRCMHSLAAAAGVWIAVTLQGCAGIQSNVLKEQQKVEGLAYHLPMRYFVLTVVRAKGSTTGADWSESEVVADTRKTYALQYNPHLIGKTETTLEASVAGLLGTANTKTTDSAAALAEVVETKRLLMKGAFAKMEGECGADGTFVYLFEGTTTPARLCGDIEYGVTPLPLAGVGLKAASAAKPADADMGIDAAAGVFYRQQRPYIAHVRAGAGSAIVVETSKILLAPNESPVMLLPYARTLFAANDGKITLDKGMPTKYEQSTDGEFVALLKVPAAVLSAYFTAMGNVFSAFTSNATKEQELAIKQYRLALLAYKLERCQEAFKKDDKTAMETLQCDSLAAPGN